MRDGKGIRNSKFEMRPAFAGHAHAWNLEIGRKCSRKACEYFTHAKDAKPRRGSGRRRDGFMQNVEMKWVTQPMS